MKTIFNDPVHWSKSAVGSQWTFGFMMVGHIFATLFIGFALYDSGRLTLLILISLFTIYLPFLYLYALRKLLLLLEDKK